MKCNNNYSLYPFSSCLAYHSYKNILLLYALLLLLSSSSSAYDTKASLNLLQHYTSYERTWEWHRGWRDRGVITKSFTITIIIIVREVNWEVRVPKNFLRSAWLFLQMRWKPFDIPAESSNVDFTEVCLINLSVNIILLLILMWLLI